MPQRSVFIVFLYTFIFVVNFFCCFVRLKPYSFLFVTWLSLADTKITERHGFIERTTRAFLKSFSTTRIISTDGYPSSSPADKGKLTPHRREGCHPISSTSRKSRNPSPLTPCHRSTCVIQSFWMTVCVVVLTPPYVYSVSASRLF